jgi:hypothetical protein
VDGSVATVFRLSPLTGLPSRRAGSYTSYLVGFGRRLTRALLPAAVVAATLALAGCSAPEPSPLTASERDDICRSLHDPVVFTAASAVYAPVFLYRKFDSAVPGGTALPHPDCSYLARSEYADRLEVFYFGPHEDLVQVLIDQLEDTGFRKRGNTWILPDTTNQPAAIARVEQFYAAPDARKEFRPYAELIGRPAVVLSITTRQY